MPIEHRRVHFWGMTTLRSRSQMRIRLRRAAARARTRAANRVRTLHESNGDIVAEGTFFVLEFHCMRVGPTGGPATREAEEMVHIVASQFCRECTREALNALDFSALSSVTAQPERHH